VYSGGVSWGSSFLATPGWYDGTSLRFGGGRQESPKVRRDERCYRLRQEYVKRTATSIRISSSGFGGLQR